MLKIAICDDDTKQIQEIIEKLQIYQSSKVGFKYEIESFTNGEMLLAKYQKEEYFDCVFLDIYMEGMNGIETAKELRALGYEGQFIFLTSSTAHALDAYQLDAVQYLLKPVDMIDFTKAVDKFCVLAQMVVSKVIIVRAAGADYRIPVNTITYTESNGHYQEIHLANGQMHSMRSTITALYEQLEDDTFMQIGKSYIINFQFVKNISASSITMLDDSKIFPPRGNQQKIREQYFAFYQKNN
ncbi:MAG: LytTR family DNA-binding domain-containing protein [Eubacteriales bacterium]